VPAARCKVAHWHHLGILAECNNLLNKTIEILQKQNSISYTSYGFGLRINLLIYEQVRPYLVQHLSLDCTNTQLASPRKKEPLLALFLTSVIFSPKVCYLDGGIPWFSAVSTSQLRGFIVELHCSVCTCLTQLYDGREIYIIYYIKNNYMFRHFSLAIFRLRNEKT